MDTKPKKSIFVCTVYITIVLAVVLSVTGIVYAQEPSPIFLRAFPDGNAVDGGNWSLGTTVHMMIDDPATADDPDYEDDATVVSSDEGWIDTYVRFDFDGTYDLKSGDEVTLSAGELFRYLVVPDLQVTRIDPDANVVAGTIEPYNTAEPYTLVHVFIGEDAELYVNANSEGAWVAEFNSIEFDLQPGMSGNVEVWFDEYNDSTIFNWTNSRFTVFPEWEFFDGLDWPDGATVIITVAGKPECTTSKESWDGFFNGNFGDGCNVEYGDEVTFTDGITTRTHNVRTLYVTDVDVDANTVSGKSEVEAGTIIYVWAHDGDFEPLRFVTSGSNKWDVNLSEVYTIRDDSEGRSEIRDAMGNATASDWHVLHPHFTVFPEWEWFDGWDWPNEAEVTITVAGKDDCTTKKQSWGYFFNGSFGEECDLEIGDKVTFTDGETTREHIVQNLAVTKTNQDDDTIKGIADPGAEVFVWPHATGQEQLAIAKTKGAANGKWIADFSGIYDLAPGECGRSEIRDGFANSTAVDWCISNPRIVASEAGDWFWTTEFKPGDLDISIYDSPDEGATLLWSGQQVADESGFAFVGPDIHGQDLVPGNYLVISDDDSQKGLILQLISVTMFDTEFEFMAGFAPAGSEVWAAAGPQDWQERIMVVADPVSGEWFANFADIEFDITEDMQPWSYAHIYDEDGDANEGSVPTLESWVAAFTYDLPAGAFTENGEYPYHFELEWSFPEPGAFSGQGGYLDISSGAPVYDGYVLLRGERELRGSKYPEGLSCEEVGEINPDQPMRFLIGWIPDYGMTYSEALTYFENLTGRVVWNDGMSAELTRHEVMPFSFDDLDAWFNYVCTFTSDPIQLADQPDWVDSGITVSAGQSFTIEAFGQMNPCSDTYPNGSEICIFYTPVGGEWAVPYENEFGIFPGPGLPFMALLGRIGDEPFYIGEGGTFTAEEMGTLWLTPNDNLRTDNQGAYSVVVWLGP